MFKIYRKFIGLILVAAFAAITFFGLNMGMDASQDGTMSGCVFNQSAVCPMGYREHINHWQGMFAAARPAQNSSLVFLVLIVLGSVALSFFPLFKRQVCARKICRVPQSILKWREITAKLSDHILQALSDGILNPKLYNSVKVIG